MLTWVSKEEANDIKRVNNKVLREVLAKGIESSIDDALYADEFKTVRWKQGYIAALKDVAKLVKLS